MQITEVIYYNDPEDQKFGTTETVTREIPDPVAPEPPSKAELMAKIQELLDQVAQLSG